MAARGLPGVCPDVVYFILCKLNSIYCNVIAGCRLAEWLAAGSRGERNAWD